MSLCLSVDKLFIRPKHNIYTFSSFFLVYLIWYFYLSVKFVVDPGLYVKADSTYAIFERFVLIIKWHAVL